MEHKKVIITGGTSGIGKKCTIELLKSGNKVAMCGRSIDKYYKLLEELNTEEKEHLFFKAFNLEDEANNLLFFNESLVFLDGLDALVNCVGANTQKDHVDDILISDLNKMYKTNVIGPLLTMQHAAKYFKSQHIGLIINIMSTCCLFDNENTGAYTATKKAFEALSKIMRKELRDDNIRLTHIYPGGVNTLFRVNERPDYLEDSDVSNVIINILNTKEHVCLDDIVLRPFVERNY